ncbi:hypothetical protein HAZT_HAZT010111 [Hyalella azteca]|uniref:Peptidase S1 domain-containing protein n=1 Tax=Hyalella azteca TaxID=294128 RepID=A0A6A0HCU3_HYAAZ|nr:hypothetical protein HAZT_HAZT010111 [Hyalella azteca]
MPLRFRISCIYTTPYLEQLCLGSEQGMDSCTGDSGGPAFAFDSSGRAVQLGLVSFGPTVACGQVAAVYTHVPYYLDSFITPNIKT